jgi:membrane protease YdiL (CAAX protease family)
VGGYREYLKVPEQWTRDYQRLRSKNEVAQTIDSAVTVVLVLGMIVIIVIRVRRRCELAARRALRRGRVVLAFFQLVNSRCEFGYPTTDSYGAFLSRQFLQALLSALGAGGLVFVLAAGAEPLYREAFGDKISLGNLFSRRGLRTKRFFLGTILGLALTGIFIAYQTAFYILAYRFGAWSPADVPYSDLLNARFPWLFVLFGGFLPAVSEEFLFRMFAIPFLRKLTVVVLAVIWRASSGASVTPGIPSGRLYPRPGSGNRRRGAGIIMRWGILPTLVWHYSVDAMYSAMLLMRSQSVYYKLSAASAGIMVLPVLVALVALARRRLQTGHRFAQRGRNRDAGRTARDFDGAQRGFAGLPSARRENEASRRRRAGHWPGEPADSSEPLWRQARI